MTVHDDLREPLVSAVRTAIGDDLRSLVSFTRDDFEQLYLRSDLERGADVEGFVGNERLWFDAVTAYGGSELGEYQFTVRAFTDGYVVRAIEGELGAFATTDRMPIAEFNEVASAMRGVLREVQENGVEQ
ncbi:hypothetical protein ACFPYI_07110 [Halomarina salina]|uniref:Uncharacterized protein n=1 Tax=Halomarina salina TaxID=1872699 RepID=A0ABD5RL94_9EURY|nr:hypothetical protein [Halomarina salina]